MDAVNDYLLGFAHQTTQICFKVLIEYGLCKVSSVFVSVCVFGVCICSSISVCVSVCVCAYFIHILKLCLSLGDIFLNGMQIGKITI